MILRQKAVRQKIPPCFQKQNVAHKSESDDPEFKKPKIKSVSRLVLNFRDPPTWEISTDHRRQILVKHDPNQVQNIDFPLGRKLVSMVKLLIVYDCK